MDRRVFLFSGAVLLAGISSRALAQAGAGCGGFRWDVAAEMALFQGQAAALPAGSTAAATPLIRTGQLYEVQLAPREKMEFVLPPARPPRSEGSHAGMLRLRVATAGRYRVSLGAHAWVDMAVAGELLPTADFQGVRGCMPDKIVMFDIPADSDVILQLSGNPDASIRVAVTAAAAG